MNVKLSQNCINDGFFFALVQLDTSRFPRAAVVVPISRMRAKRE